MDMLHGDNKIFFTFYFLLFVFCFSCKNEKNRIIEMSKQYEEVSKRNSGTEYLLVLQGANDSLNYWIKNKIYNSYQLDSLICFNRSNDKLVGALLSEDGIKLFYGVKIKGLWYFFSGAYIVLLQEFYKNEKWPLSQSKLHEIAMEEVFSGYLIKDTWGNWQINDKFFNRFDEMFNDTREFEEKYHNKKFNSNEEFMDWYVKTLVEVNWSTRDTTNKK